MKILYYNLQLGCFDGSNMHALGMLNALKKICGEENIYVANDVMQLTYNHRASKLKRKVSKVLKPIRILRRNYLSRKNVRSIIEKINNDHFKPDYILARSQLYDKTPVLLAKRIGCKLIIEHNESLVYECCKLKKSDSVKSVKSYENMIFKNADGIYVVSDVLKQIILINYPTINDNKVISIPNGYMNELYDIQDEQKNLISKRIRKEMGTENKWVVIFIGSLQNWHGIEKLLTAARNMNYDKDVVFWVLGDGEKRDVIQEYTKEYNNLKWFGNVPFEKMRDLLISSDLGIMPYENMDNFYFSPLKLFDMIGAQLPFIGLKIGQIESICLQDFNNNFLLNTASPDEIISRINYLRNNKDTYHCMKNLLIYKTKNHTWDTRARILFDWMSEI